MTARRFVLAQSWWLATQLARRHPALHVVETHPGGGQYDCLTLTADFRTSLIDINRVGRIHVRTGDPIEPISFDEVFADDDPGRVVTVLEEAARLGSPAQAPPSTPEVLTYRVLAAVAALTVNDRRHWDVRNEVLDESGMDGGVRGHVSRFPVAAERARRDPRRFWAVLRDDEPVAVLDTDGFAYVGEQVFHLPDQYTAAGRRITPILATALGTILY